MRSRRVYYCVLLTAVGISLLITGPANAQSVQLGNALIDVQDPQGESIFRVDDSDVTIGATGTDTDFEAYESTGNRTLWFNTSLAQFYLGGPDSGGDVYLYNNASVITFTAAGDLGDLTIGGGAVDGDLFIRDSDGSTATITADGELGDLTLGAQGVAGDDGDLYLRDTDGVTNNITLDGASGNVVFGASGGTDDGDLDLYDGSGMQGIYLRGDQGNVVNKLVGNGIVKAWAQINADGTVASCYRCSALPADTNRIVTGIYEVDFTIDADITSRPVLCSVGSLAVGTTLAKEISCVARTLDTSSVYVRIGNSTGVETNSAFTIVVF